MLVRLSRIVSTRYIGAGAFDLDCLDGFLALCDGFLTEVDMMRKKARKQQNASLRVHCATSKGNHSSSGAAVPLALASLRAAMWC